MIEQFILVFKDPKRQNDRKRLAFIPEIQSFIYFFFIYLVNAHQNKIIICIY